MIHTTNRTGPSLAGQHWYAGSTGASKSCSITFTVEDSCGSTVGARITDPIDYDVNWADVVVASTKTSLAFLENEPDLYED